MGMAKRPKLLDRRPLSKNSITRENFNLLRRRLQQWNAGVQHACIGLRIALAFYTPTPKLCASSSALATTLFTSHQPQTVFEGFCWKEVCRGFILKERHNQNYHSVNGLRRFPTLGPLNSSHVGENANKIGRNDISQCNRRFRPAIARARRQNPRGFRLRQRCKNTAFKMVMMTQIFRMG